MILCVALVESFRGTNIEPLGREAEVFYSIESNENQFDKNIESVLELNNQIFERFDARYTESLEFLIEYLNRYHKLNLSKRFWTIVLGHWLRRMVYTELYVKLKVDALLENPRGSRIYCYPLAAPIAAVETEDIKKLAASADWLSNFIQNLYSDNKKFVEIKTEVDRPIDHINDSIRSNNFSLTIAKRWIINILLGSWNHFVNLLSPTAKFFVTGAFLSKFDLIKTSFYLRELPRFYREKRTKLDASSYLHVKRIGVKQMCGNFSDSFFDCLVENIPICYVEDFDALRSLVSTEKVFPKSCRVIFTANNFDTDEKFKVYTGFQVEDGAKYLTAQHGSNYGTHRFINPSVEELVADTFITWGWTKPTVGGVSYFPGFNFRASNEWSAKWRVDGPILLIAGSVEHSVEFLGSLVVGHVSALRVVSLCDRLINTGFKKVVVKVAPDLQPFAIGSDWWFKERLPFDGVKFSIGENIRDLASDSGMVIHCYDSTGFLNCISLNRPTIMFLPIGLVHLRDDVVPIYERLMSSGLVFSDPQQLVLHLIKIDGHISNWWHSVEIQSERKWFMKRLCNAHDNSEQGFRFAQMVKGSARV